LDYKHGIYGGENPTPTLRPKQSSTVLVVVGTGPVNLVSNSIINEPVLVTNFDQAEEAFGFSDEFDNYTLCASMELGFNVFKTAPMVLINVLDPAKHKTDIADKLLDVSKFVAVSDVTGIIKDTVVVKNEAGDTTYVTPADYSLAFRTDGKLEVKLTSDGAAKAEIKLSLSYSVLDPTLVTDEEIIGAYDQATHAYTGIEVVRQVFPRLSEVAGILIAPGYSHKPAIARKLEEISRDLNECFNVTVLLDADPTITDYSLLPAWKIDNDYKVSSSNLLWPMIKVGGIIYWYSAIAAGRIQLLDFEAGNVPYKSPSNKTLPCDAAVLKDGTEIYLEQAQGNELNAAGIVTAINLSGWRMWGNETCAYPEITDPKERYIMTRRMFDFINNTFILKFLDRVDDPTNVRLIESVVDEFNMYLNGLQSQGMITAGKITFDYTTATQQNLLEGKLKFITSLGSHVPAKEITHITEFDPSGLISIGGE
jgi:phage tail sheath protein FI